MYIAGVQTPATQRTVCRYTDFSHSFICSWLNTVQLSNH